MIGDAKGKLNRGHRAFQQPNLTRRVIYLYERRPELFNAIPRSHLATLLGMHRNTLQQLIDTLSPPPCPTDTTPHS
nr:hypothetical protein [uncultured Porphyromonas sp.]